MNTVKDLLEKVKELSEKKKEFWEMSKKEWKEYTTSLNKQYNDILLKLLKGTGFENDPQSPVYRNKSFDAFEILQKREGINLDFGILGGYGHENKIKAALSMGKTVPPKVLKDYRIKI